MITLDDPAFVTALARGLAVLTAFDAERPEMTLGEVASAAGVAPATARRSLLTLEALGYVRVRGRKFLLTPRVLDLSAAFLTSMNMQQVAQQYLRDIVDATGDSSSVAIRDGAEVVYVASVSVKRAVRLTAAVGSRYAAFASSTGRVLLAHAGAEERRAILSGGALAKLTSHTETDPRRLEEILVRVREDGYATSLDQIDYGVLSIAVPIRAPDGRVFAAVNCSTSPSRVTVPDLVATRLPVLREGAERIAAELRLNPTLVHSVGG